MSKEKRIFICHTYFHLLVSIIKSIDSKKDNYLLITTYLNERTLFNDKDIIARLNKMGLFKEIILIDDSSANDRVKNNLPIYYAFLRKIAKKYKKILKNFNEIFIFNDETLIGKTLTISGLRYVLAEDGIDSMKNPQYIPRKSVKKQIMRMLKIYQLAQSPNILRYEVNDKSIVPKIYNEDKIIEIPKKVLFGNLSKENKEKLLEIFGVQGKIVTGHYDVLILTQPFDIGFPHIPEEKKIDLYRKIIERYRQKKVLIKTHPREKTDYAKYFPNASIVREKFPVELLNFLPVAFSDVVTVSSTAAIYNTEETIVLGWDWLDKETGGAVYGKK